MKKNVKPLEFAVFDAISHHIINKYYKWCYIKIVLLTIRTFETVPTADQKSSYVHYVKFSESMS